MARMRSGGTTAAGSPAPVLKAADQLPATFNPASVVPIALSAETRKGGAGLSTSSDAAYALTQAAISAQSGQTYDPVTSRWVNLPSSVPRTVEGVTRYNQILQAQAQTAPGGSAIYDRDSGGYVRSSTFALPEYSEYLGSYPTTGRARRHKLSTVSSQLDGYSGDDLGFSLGKIVSNIGKTISKAASDTGRAVAKAATQTGHIAGEIATSKIGQAVTGTVLAATGVGIPAAAAILAAQKGVGSLIKPGGNLGKAATGAIQGAAEGTVASLAGKGVSKLLPKVTDQARGVVNALLPGNPLKRVATSTVAASAIPLLMPTPTGALPPVEMATYNPTTPALGPATRPTGKTSRPTPVVVPGGVYDPGGVGTMTVSGSTIDRNGNVRPIAKPTSPTLRAAASTVLKAGQQGRGAADDAATATRRLGSRAAELARKAALVAAAGDAIGADQLSQLASQASQLAQQVSTGSMTAGNALQTAGMAIEGAATGAVAGAGAGGAMQWVKENPVLAGGIAVAGLFVAHELVGGRGSGGGGGRRSSRHVWAD